MKIEIILFTALSMGIAGFGHAATGQAASAATEVPPSQAMQAQPAPTFDRFSSPDDQRLGVEVRGIVIETVGPNESKEIFIFVDKGDVQLTGTAKSEERKRAIIDALRANKGVKSVNNKLTVLSAAKK